MFENLRRILVTKEFIENYPGLSSEEQKFMRKMRTKYYSRQSNLKRNVTSISSIVSVPILIGSMMWSLPTRKILGLLVVLPITVYTLGKLVPFIDFSMNHSIYIKEIYACKLPLTEVLLESSLNKDNS